MDGNFDKEAKEARANKSNSRAPEKSKISAETILETAANIDFSNPKSAQEWESLHKDKLAKKPGNQVLHLLASKKTRSNGGKVWEDHQTKAFLDWILQRHHSLLEKKNKDLYTPLHQAIMAHNNAFVDAVLQNTNLVNLGTVLLETCQYGNSLHVAILNKLPSMEIMIKKCAQFNDIFTKGQLDNGNTPLHTCMSMDQDEDGDDGDDNDDAEYESSENEVNADIESRRSEDGDGVGDDAIPGLNNGCQVTLKNNSILQPLRQRTKSFDIQGPTMKSLKVVKDLIEHYDDALTQRNNENRTPYQARVFILTKQYQSAPPGPDADRARELIANDPILSYIRYYCVKNKNFPHDKVMEALYHPSKERHIEFDLAGLPHPIIQEDYLDRLSKHLQFESILKYVALPKLAVEPSMAVRRGKGEKQLQKRGLSHMVTVFDWLRKNHVEKIVKVMVIDDVDPSHSDASIVKALRNFGIEIWDWKKLDLSSDVIWKATTGPGNKEVSVAEEISLYSSGNHSVLMGWASPRGLTNKDKFPALKKVNLFIRQGLEDKDEIGEYIKEFKEIIRAETEDRVKVNHILDNEEVSYASEFKSSEESLRSENKWIDCVTTFAKLLRSAPASTVRPVKVAIIDDGVDAAHLSLDGQIAIGKSFCPYANSTGNISPYYVPSGNHGTNMAILVSKICPKVSLYVAKLDERQAPESSHRQITAKSAAEAIRWATESGVDIISMSWTIETPVTGNEEMESLKNAVREAANKEILMFCSTSDQGSSTKDHCYPGDFDGCIKIGGATDTGEALAWVNPDKVKFLMPGKSVPFINNDGKIGSYQSGSSIATAAASALAGLLLFSTWLVNKDDRYLQDQKNMTKAFKNLSRESPKCNFPLVHDYFDVFFKKELAECEIGDEGPKNLKRPFPSYDLQTIEWDEKCDTALKNLLKQIKQDS